jgi:flagellar protein FlaG
MAIKSLDASAGVELIHPKALAAIQRRSRSPAAANVTDKAPPSPARQLQDAERLRAEQQKAAQDNPGKLADASETLRFHVDKDSGKTVAELVDHEGQVVRQMPTEEALEVAKAIGKFQGMFVNLKV